MKNLILPLMIGFILLVGCGKDTTQKSSEAPETNAATDTGVVAMNAELYQMFQEDQADRMAEDIDWDVVHERDTDHRKRVREMFITGEIRVADDFFHAAMILQHGEGTDDYRFAHELALRATQLDSTHDSAWWLAAAAWDRYQWSMDQPQWYGTQYHQVDGKWTIEPIDTTKVTDEDRALWHVQTLAKAREQAVEMNKQDN